MNLWPLLQHEIADDIADCQVGKRIKDFKAHAPKQEQFPCLSICRHHDPVTLSFSRRWLQLCPPSLHSTTVDFTGFSTLRVQYITGFSTLQGSVHYVSLCRHHAPVTLPSTKRWLQPPIPTLPQWVSQGSVYYGFSTLQGSVHYRAQYITCLSLCRHHTQ